MTNEEFIKSISLDGEEWQDVPGYEGLYIASIFGRIVALNRKEGIPFAGMSPHLMSPYLTQKGY